LHVSKTNVHPLFPPGKLVLLFKRRSLNVHHLSRFSWPLVKPDASPRNHVGSVGTVSESFLS
jgi:hypothetical protein